MRVLVRRVLSAAALGMAAACGSDIVGPPSTTPTQEAIGAALVEAGVLSNRVGGLAVLALAQIDSTAKIGTFDAAGIEIAWDLPDIGGGGVRDVGYFSGVVGWTGLNVSGKTAEEVFAVGASGSGTSVLTNGSVVVNQCTNNRCGEATYYKRTPLAFYNGTSGSFTLTAGSFTGSGSCATSGGGGVTAQCTATHGQMTGSFDFTAQLVSGTGNATYTQPNATYATLPSVQVVITAQ